MKKILLLFALVATAVCGVEAKRVSPTMALGIAQQVFGGGDTRGSDLCVVWDSSRLDATRSDGSEPTFYVVSPNSGVGFVIVAGDDVIAPVLAYSENYPISDEGMLPPNFEAWLRYVDSAVCYARERGLEANDATAAKWNEGYMPVEAIRLNTARWSQGAPYNLYCPMDGDALSLTGCTQTAMAEVMHYYRWPEAATGSSEPFTTQTKGINVPSRDLNHSYDWDNMLDEYNDNAYTIAEAEAVATLIADLGHSFKADYSAEGTGALPDVVAMYANYGYSPACHYAMRDNYTSEGWNSAMRAEIEASRPVFYSGYTDDGFGHAFVLDGVDANDYFHVNWGWGGLCDGFFMLDDLVLEDYVFSSMHWALLGLHPMRDGEVDNWLYVSSPGIMVSEQEFATGVEFTVDGVTIANPSILDFSGEVRIGVCDYNGEFKSWATEAVSFELASNYITSTYPMRAVVAEEIVAGDRLRAFYRSNSSSEWFEMLPYMEYACSEVVLCYPTIGQTTSLSYNRNNGVMVVEYDDDVRAALYLDGEMVNSGVNITTGRMIIDTKQLSPITRYTIYLERKDVEVRELMFTINEM